MNVATLHDRKYTELLLTSHCKKVECLKKCIQKINDNGRFPKHNEAEKQRPKKTKISVHLLSVNAMLPNL
jgi:hypothetical protein